MKKIKLLPILFLLPLFVFTFNKAKAAPGDSCTSAISSTLGSLSDYAFHSPDTAEWFSFIADSSNMVITLALPILPADTPTEYLHTLKLYSGNCSGLTLLGTSSIRFGSDSLPVIYKTGLTIGTKYYVSVSKYNSIGCRICNKYPSYFSMSIRGAFSTPMVGDPCVSAPCAGPNLVCNWNFTSNAPPLTPVCYDMSSATCYSSPTGPKSGMNYTSFPCILSGLCDEYLINSVDYNPTLFVSPVGPSSEPYSFWGDSPNFNQPCTTVNAWEQIISGLTLNVTYQFSMYYMDLDNLANPNIDLINFPPATLKMYINGGSPLVAVIANTNNWTEVCYHWTANSTTADLQITTDCELGGGGYDFQLNEISFDALSLSIVMANSNPLCYGGAGSATVSIVSGTSPYIYSWSPSGGTNASATGLSVGTYTVLVTDNQGCTATASATITQPALLTATMGAPTDPLCYGGAGTATVTAGGGTLPYISYSWSPVGGINPIGTGLTAGSYTVTVTDILGCTATASVTITQPPALTAIMSPPTNPLCNGGPGSATVTAGGGTLPYAYLWSPGSQTNANATGLTAGSYTVTVTDNNGCTITASVSITQPALLTVGLPSNPFVCGASGVTSLFATPGGGTPTYSYLWTPTSQTTATATGLSAGTYSVRVTDANGCTASNSVTINVSPLPAVPTISGPLYACGSSPFTYSYTVTNPDINATYAWTVNGGTNNTVTASGTSVTAILRVSPATFTITATYTTNCASSATYTVGDCCANTVSSGGGNAYDFIFTNVTGSGNYINKTILINGTYTINGNTFFTACDVQFTPGSSIVLTNSSTLTLQDNTTTNCTHLHAACDTMWDGIYINHGCTLFAPGVTGAVLIEDAKNAVVVNPSSLSLGLFELGEVIFNKNYEDIIINSTTSIYGGAARDCMFTCRDLSGHTACYWYPSYKWTTASTTSSHATLIYPYNGQRSYKGIELKTVGGYSGFERCFFDYHHYGVYATNSNLGVNKNIFQNLFMISSDAGIYSTGNALNGNALTVGLLSPNEFINCYNGIIAPSFINSVHIVNNLFDDSASIGTGFTAVEVANSKVPNNPLNYLNVSNDTIKNFYTGIWAKSNQTGSGIITYNLIINDFCQPIIHHGIVVNDVHGKIYSISFNHITGLTYPIYANGLSNATICGNNINLNSSAPSCSYSYYYGKGIEFDDGINSRIVNNNILAANQVSAHPVHYVGIYTSTFNSSMTRCNTITGAQYQIQADATNLASEIYTNNLNTGGGTDNIGLYFTTSAYVSASIGNSKLSSGNTWNTTAPLFLCRSEYYSGALPVPKYYSYTSHFTCAWADYPNCGTCNAAFNPQRASSASDSACPAPRAPLHSGSYVVVDSVTIDTLSSDSIPAAFNNPPDSTSIAYMENVALGHDSLNLIGDTNIIFNKEALLEVLWQNKGLLSSYSILNSFNDSISKTTLGRIWKIDSCMIYLNSGGTITGSYPALLDSINHITPASNVETNLETALSGYLNLIINDSLSAMQLSAQWTLASKCPDKDGPGVYMARAIVSMYDSVQPTYYDSVCGTGNTPHKPVKVKDVVPDSGVQINLYPNPNNGNFTLEYNLGNETSGKVRLFNLVGEVVGEYTLNSAQGKMSISNPALSNGVYFWKLYTENQASEFGKVIIMK